jgi:hypothetical protein
MHTLYDFGQKRIPPGETREGLGLRGTSVAASALQRRQVLAEIIGQPDDG